MADIHILVVEDEPDGADVVERMLRAVGVKASLVGNAEAALQTLDSNAVDYFDCVIIDLALPGMDGFELMQTIRHTTDFADLPLVAITAYHTPELKVKALDSGFDAYFAKPLDTNLFMQSLEKLIGD